MGDRSSSRPRNLSTLAVHAGELVDHGWQSPSSVPIYASSSFVAETPEALEAIFAGETAGYVYSRHGNPTTAAFERAVALLEGASTARAFSSGMAAIHGALLALELRAGDTVLAARDMYGTTLSLLDVIFSSLGVQIVTTSMNDLEAVRQLCQKVRPRVLLVEVLSNPLLRVVDLPALAEIARHQNAALLVDSTFATPCLCRPLNMGATAVIHSITKYLAGHGDVTGGVVAVSEEYAAGLSLLGRLVGGVLSPFESFLALRGLKTLPLRFERQSHSAARIAVELEDHPYVKRVYYPGLPSHPDHDLVQRLFGSFPLGGVLSFEIKRLDREAAFTFLRQLKLVQSATTLGDVCSLALYPVMSSHRALSSAQRHEAGISDGLIRLSIGLEDPEDILADLDQALRGVRI